MNYNSLNVFISCFSLDGGSQDDSAVSSATHHRRMGGRKQRDQPRRHTLASGVDHAVVSMVFILYKNGSELAIILIFFYIFRIICSRLSHVYLNRIFHRILNVHIFSVRTNAIKLMFFL